MKKFFTITIKTLGALLSLIFIYVILSILIPYIPVQAKATPEQKTVTGFIMTNGVHTDIVVPIKTEYMDWQTKFPSENTLSQRTDYQYIGIGWGDKGFYLDTPTWAELKPSTALKAAFWLGDAAVHTTYYDTVKVSDSVKRFTMSERQYLQLIDYIENSMDKDANGNYILIKTDAVYGKNDAFYEAKGSYSFLFTCNTWSNKALKKAEQKAALWTVTDRGIFQHYK